jgi:NAD(P)-dependent dehydrogenase (short-subunit alcohol dehydrogenase family)
VCGPVLTDDDTRRLAAQHRYQARRDGVDILRAYDARTGHQLEDAGPLDRYGHVEEVAALVAFVPGPEASYITGANLTVDGGTNA